MSHSNPLQSFQKHRSIIRPQTIHLSVAVLAAFGIVLATLGLRWSGTEAGDRTLRNALAGTEYVYTNRDLVARSIADYAKSNSINAAVAMNGRVAVVTYFGKKACVSLQPRGKVLSFSPTYCYDRGSRELKFTAWTSNSGLARRFF